MRFLRGTGLILKCYLYELRLHSAGLCSASGVEASVRCFFGLSGETAVDIRTGDTKRVAKQLSNCEARGAALLLSCLLGTGSHASFVCCAGSAWLTAMYGRDLSVSRRGVAGATGSVRATTAWIRTSVFAQQSNRPNGCSVSPAFHFSSDYQRSLPNCRSQITQQSVA